MADVTLPPPDDDPSIRPEPFEEELVAYLDGELEPAAANEVEARLAADPAARAQAAALKKTFELLDYLPRPEPSATFATRTLDRLPAVKSGSGLPSSSRPMSTAHGQTPSGTSTSVPGALSSGNGVLRPHRAAQGWVWAVGIVVAAAGFGTAGYFGATALRLPQHVQRGTPSDEVSLSDRRLVENLPLYAGADDLDFVVKLADPELFGDDPAVSYPIATKTQSVDPDGPVGPAFDALAKAFKELPPARQQAIRDLDQQLHARDASSRDRLIRVLEVYVLWLNRLPEGERKSVLSAATPGRRIDELRTIRDRQWLESLPAVQRGTLAGLDANEKAKLVGQWKQAESERREEWAFVREHADDIAANKAPWPFNSTEDRNAVIEYAKSALRPDDLKRTRLNANETDRYKTSLQTAQRTGGWAWYAYGKTVYDLSGKYQKFLLPEPAAGEPVTTYAQLGKAERFFEKGKGRDATVNVVGKWPEFALAVDNFATGAKGEKMNLPPLGPAKPSEFKEPLRVFWSKELSLKLSSGEKAALQRLEGQWPEYPREFVRLARHHNLSAPGVMLPGPPRLWEATYQNNPFRSAPRP